MVNLDALEKATDGLVKATDRLEKSIAKMKLQSQKLADQIEALNSQFEDSIVEIRALRASPLTKFPKFDGSEALAWLARANQYFLTNKTPSDRRVDVAIKAISGPAMPWLKLLLMRCSSLSWDKFTQELLRRFGDAAVRVAKIQPKIPPTSNDNTATILPSLPTVTAPLLSSSPPTTAKKNTLHAIQQPPPIQQTCRPFILSRPMPFLVLETIPFLPTSHDIPLLQPPPIFLAHQKFVPAAATFQSTPVKPHACDSQPKDFVTFSAVLYPAPAADDSPKPEISSPTSEGHHHTSNPPPLQPLPLALPQQQPWQNMELVPQPAPVPALVAIHHLEAVPVPIHMSTSDARRNTVLHSLPKKHFTTIYFSSQSTVQSRQYSAIGFCYIQSFSSIHILCGLLFCTLLSSLKHESAPPWLNSTLALRARLFRQ